MRIGKLLFQTRNYQIIDSVKFLLRSVVFLAICSTHVNAQVFLKNDCIGGIISIDPKSCTELSRTTTNHIIGVFCNDDLCIDDNDYLYSFDHTGVYDKYEFNPNDIRLISSNNRVAESIFSQVESVYYNNDSIFIARTNGYFVLDLNTNNYQKIFDKESTKLSAKSIVKHKDLFFVLESYDNFPSFPTIIYHDLYQLDVNFQNKTLLIDSLIVGRGPILQSMQCNCEEVKLLITGENNMNEDLIYEINIENHAIINYCNFERSGISIGTGTGGQLYGFPEWKDCELSIDLDLDDESVQFNRDVYLNDFCGYTNLPISGQNVQVFAIGGKIDSIVIQLIDGKSGQFLTGIESNEISILDNNSGMIKLIGTGNESFNDYERVIKSLRLIDEGIPIIPRVQEVSFIAYRYGQAGITSIAHLNITEAEIFIEKDTSIYLCHDSYVDDLSIFLSVNPDIGIWEMGETFDASTDLDGVYNYILSGIHCPDDTIKLDINVFPPPENNYKELSYCPNDSILFNGVYIKEEIILYDTVSYKSFDCDSIITEILFSQLESPLIEVVDTSVCYGLSYELNNKYYSLSGLIQDTIRSVRGCDSILLEHLVTFSPSPREIELDTVLCKGEEIIIDGETFVAPSSKILIVKNNFECDSIIYNIDIGAYEISEELIDTFFCANGEIEIGGRLFSEDFYGEFILPNSKGCDSILYFLNLNFHKTVRQEIDTVICNGGEINFNGEIIDVSGTYFDTLKSKLDCDSLISVLNLSFDSVVQETIIIDTILCDGEILLIDDNIYDSPISEEFSIISDQGCDSLIYLLDLSFISPMEKFVDTVLCAGDFLEFDEFSLSENIEDIFIVKDRNSCDSIIYHIRLEVKEVDFFQLDTMLCTGDIMEFEDFEFTESTQEIITLSSINGCDSLTVNLNINFQDTIILPTQYFTVQRNETTTINVHYENQFKQLEWQPSLGLSCPQCLTSDVKISHDKSYKLIISSEEGCTEILNVIIAVNDRNQAADDYYLPTVINLNNSENNSFFLQTPLSKPPVNYSLHIFDRWGNELFGKHDIESNEAKHGWMGINNDQLVGQGVYLYQILTTNGLKMYGSVTLLN